MAVNIEPALAAIVPRLKTTDISPYIDVAGLIVPRVFDNLVAGLNERQRRAIHKVMPMGGGKNIYLQLVDTPTPPIVIGMAQPLRISTMLEKDVKQQKIEGIRLTTDDIMLLAKGRSPGNMLKIGWRLKGQMLTIISILWMFGPLLRLGPSIINDMGNDLDSRTKPLLDVFFPPKYDTT